MKSIVLSNISDELYWKLKVIALAERTNVTHFVTTIVEKHLVAYEKKNGKTIIFSPPAKKNIPVRIAKKRKSWTGKKK